MSTGGIPIQVIAAELGFPLPGGFGGVGGLMSSFANRVKWPLIIEQIPVNGYAGSRIRYEFDDDDLPDDLELGGKLETVQIKYPNNTIPDTQVIRTEENNITLNGHFWCIDQRGRSPIDKAELLEIMRIEGLPVRLIYMGGRIVRFAFIIDYKYKIHDETDIEWEMELQVYKHGDVQGTSGNLNQPLTSTHGRAADIIGRLNSNGAALLEMRSRIGRPSVNRDLRGMLSQVFPDVDAALEQIAAARNGYQAAGSFEEMASQNFQTFANQVSSAARSVSRVLQVIRQVPNDPVGAAERALGMTGQQRRRNLLREASITFQRVKEDLTLLNKDAQKVFEKKNTIHIVTDNDSLRSIAYKYYGDSARWQDIARANKITDPSRIGGMRLIIP